MPTAIDPNLARHSRWRWLLLIAALLLSGLALQSGTTAIETRSCAARQTRAITSIIIEQIPIINMAPARTNLGAVFLLAGGSTRPSPGVNGPLKPSAPRPLMPPVMAGIISSHLYGLWPRSAQFRVDRRLLVVEDDPSANSSSRPCGKRFVIHAKDGKRRWPSASGRRRPGHRLRP
jgi:hypothetical protein